MAESKFSTQAYGKWLLSGEHAVLRGSKAIAFPLKSRVLQLDFQSGGEKIEFEFKGERGFEYELVLAGLLDRALEHVGHSRSDIKGKLVLTSNLPLGGGLGASATLCVVVARWFAYMGWAKESELYEFARKLENIFHGESSGVDIAIALSGNPLLFSRAGMREVIDLGWQPKLFISYTGQRASTKDCVDKVKDLFIGNSRLAKTLDEQMGASVELCLRAIVEKDESKLVQGMNLAASCFTKWGLAEGLVRESMDKLLSEGALAVKPTGSGGGGYVLSLWKEAPSNADQLGLISCF